MATYDTTGRYGLRALLGTNVVSDIDVGFKALRDDVDAKLTPYTAGPLAGRPTSTPGSPGIAGRTYRPSDRWGVDLDLGTSWQTMLPAPPMVTSLPVAPVDGQECYLKHADGVVWHLRYRAALATQKWEVIGAADWVAFADASGSCSASNGITAVLNAGNVGIFTAVAPGVYLARAEGQATNIDATYMWLGVAKWVSPGGIAPSDDSSVALNVGSGGTPQTEVIARTRQLTLAAGESLAMFYFADGGTVTYARKALTVRPLRLG